MRRLGLFAFGLVLAGVSRGQTMTEFGAAAAAGTVGGAAGKGVSDGVTSIFGKLDQQTKAAAKQDPDKAKQQQASVTSAPQATVSSATPSAAPQSAPVPTPRPRPTSKSTLPPARIASASRLDPPVVPDPPALPSHRVVSKPAPPPARPVAEFVPIVPPPPPPPEMTTDQLKSIVAGAKREEILKLGVPASRITMFDDGHLLEIYSYTAKNTTFGVVRLSDGAVSRVELR
jgi:hypothetical protein